MQRKFGPERHNGRSDTLVVVPAFNEQNNIICVLREIQTSLPEADILVINDCSHDDTAAIARSVEGVAVVDLPCNLGIGGAMQTGFKYALNKDYDYVVQIDGDGGYGHYQNHGRYWLYSRFYQNIHVLNIAGGPPQ